MSKLWSKYIQTSDELYMTRAVRFRQDNAYKWLPYTQIKNGMKIIDIGCAGGLLCHRVKEILPSCEVYGIDRDSGHIEYAKEKSQELKIDCNFEVGDATKIPFEDNSFDLTISHTVMEHVEPDKFLNEQYRVLKDGGVITVMSVRAGLNISSNYGSETSDDEIALFERARVISEEFENKNGVCKYNLTEREIIEQFQKVGFKNIDIQYTSIDWYTPDNANISTDIAIKQIEAKRLLEINYVQKSSAIKKNIFSDSERQLLLNSINERYDRRIQKYKNGEKVWDFNISGLLIVTGIK